MSENTPRAVAGMAGCCAPPTLDKMMHDRKHLVSAEVEKLIAATKGTSHETRDCCLLLLMFRHGLRVSEACGFALADQGADTRLIQDYLGHRNIQHTVKYTATNPARFERLWR
jgi:site-specific recombinase XerD